MSNVSSEIYTHVSPSLHPDNVKQVVGYEQNSGYLNGVVESLSVSYEGVAKTHQARMAAERNPTMNDAGRLIVVGNFALKEQKVIATKVDATMASLDKGIKGLEGMLATPLKSAATGNVPTEIRAHVKSLSLKARNEFLSNAERANDTETLVAILGAPAYLTGMTTKEREVRTRMYHENNTPEVAGRLQAMKAGRDLLVNRSALVFGEMEKAIGARWSDVAAVRNAKAQSDSFAVEGV